MNVFGSEGGQVVYLAVIVGVDVVESAKAGNDL